MKRPPVTDRLCEALRALPGVVEGHSRFGTGRNRAWTIDGREFAHLHSESLLDLRLPRAAQRALRGDARARFRAAASEWVELEFHSESDVARIAALAAVAVRANRKRK
jgi:hypothetical protein